MSGRYLVRGFPNMGNTCFLNSVMHALLSIDPLRGHFINLKPCDGSVTNALKNLVTGTSLPRSDHLTSLEDLFRCIVAVDPTFKGNQHQDSHEFLRRLIAELSREEDMNWRKSGKTDKFRNSSDPPPGQVERMFTGQLSDVVSCGTCSRFRRKDSLFSDLLLEIPNRKGAQVSLDDCLNQFTRHELLTRDNSWDCGGECGKVKVLRDSKRMEIHTGPRILTIMLKRYTKVEPAGKFIKLENRVTFAERLQLPVNPYPRPAGKVEYCLIGVVCHMGSMDLGKGHYAVYFRGDRKGQSENDFAWYLASDAEVTEVSLEKVLSCDADDAHAYMLFYGNSCEFGSAIPIDSSVYRPSYPSAFDVLAGLCRYRLRSDPGLGDYRFPRMNV